MHVMVILKWIGITFFSFLLLFVLLIALLDWNWVRDHAIQQVSEMTGRTLTIEGDLDIDWSLVPRVQIAQVRLENAAWSDKPYMLELAAMDFRIDLRELIMGQIVLPEVSLLKPSIYLEKSADGKANWEFDIIPVADPAPEDRTEFPIIKQLRIDNGLIAYFDPSTQTDLTATLSSVRGKERIKESVVLQAKGKIEGKKLKIDLKADALLALQESDVPYQLAIMVQLDEAVTKINGSLQEPLQLKGLAMHLEMQGPNPGRLSTILGFPLPDLPPYRLKGDLSRQGDTWKFLNFDGRVGDSDLTGDIHVDTSREPLFVKADIASQKLDIDDLGPLLGIAPDTGDGEMASSSQKKEARQEEASIAMLPHEPINFEAIKQINAEVSFRGKRVESILPLDDVTMQVNIDDGRLILAPLNFGVANGNVRSRFELDASKKTVASKIETEIRRVRLSEIFRHIEIADESVGLIGGRGVFWFEGDSIAEMLASGDGGLLMLMTGGKFDDLLVEIAGLDVGESIAALIGDQEDTGINCAFIDLPTENGVMELDALVVDTKDTVFLGKGTIDFAKERLDLVIDPKPKDLSLFSARAPLHIEGRFGAPDFAPGASAILRGAASLAMLPSAPIASMIALLQEERNQENIYCSGLVEAINEAR